MLTRNVGDRFLTFLLPSPNIYLLSLLVRYYKPVVDDVVTVVPVVVLSVVPVVVVADVVVPVVAVVDEPVKRQENPHEFHKDTHCVQKVFPALLLSESPQLLPHPDQLAKHRRMLALATRSWVLYSSSTKLPCNSFQRHK